jgi:hypothetical protein
MHRPLFLIDKGDRSAFGFVRNPWDRQVSLWAFLHQRKVTDLDFKTWLMETEHWANYDKYWPGYPCHQRRSQMWWLEGCDSIGRFENLENDFTNICFMHGIPIGPVPHINRSEHGPYDGYYDDETRAFVAHHFKLEIERFGYEFERG